MLLAAVCIGFVVGVASVAEAAVFEDLYLVAVDQEPQAASSQEALVRRGMATLLTRITGQRDIARDARVNELIARAADYSDYLEPTDTGVRVGFRGTQINDALERLGLPIWIAERPGTMLWLAVDLGDGQRAVLTRSNQGSSRRQDILNGVPSNPLADDKLEQFEAVVAAVSRAINERGLPVVLPALDASERQAVRFADIWGGFDIPVMRVAEDYQVDAVLMAAVSLAGEEPTVRWTLRRSQRRQARQSSELRAGIDWIADQFASEFTTTGGARLTWLTVRGIESWPDYGRTRDYLESVSLVESVEMETLTATGELLLRVAARGDDRQLQQVLALDGELVSLEPEFGNPERSDAGSLIFVPSWRQPARNEDLP